MKAMELKQNRKIAQLTQSDLAGKLNVSIRTLQNWESGSIAIPPSRIKQINESINENLKESESQKEIAFLKGQLKECQNNYKLLLKTIAK